MQTEPYDRNDDDAGVGAVDVDVGRVGAVAVGVQDGDVDDDCADMYDMCGNDSDDGNSLAAVETLTPFVSTTMGEDENSCEAMPIATDAGANMEGTITTIAAVIMADPAATTITATTDAIEAMQMNTVDLVTEDTLALDPIPDPTLESIPTNTHTSTPAFALDHIHDPVVVPASTLLDVDEGVTTTMMMSIDHGHDTVFAPVNDTMTVDVPPVDASTMNALTMDESTVDAPTGDTPTGDALPPVDAPTMDAPPQHERLSDEPPMNEPPMDEPPLNESLSREPLLLPTITQPSDDADNDKHIRKYIVGDITIDNKSTATDEGIIVNTTTIASIMTTESATSIAIDTITDVNNINTNTTSEAAIEEVDGVVEGVAERVVEKGVEECVVSIVEGIAKDLVNGVMEEAVVLSVAKDGVDQAFVPVPSADQAILVEEPMIIDEIPPPPPPPLPPCCPPPAPMSSPVAVSMSVPPVPVAIHIPVPVAVTEPVYIPRGATV